MFAASPMAISSASDDSSSTSSTQRMEVADRRSYLQELPREVLRVQADELDVPQDATVAQMVTAILQAQDIEHDRVVALRLAAALGETDQEFVRPVSRPAFLSVDSENATAEETRPAAPLDRSDSEASFLSAREFPLPRGSSDDSRSTSDRVNDSASESSGGGPHIRNSLRAVVGAVGHTLVQGVMATLSGAASEEGDSMDDSPLAAIIAAQGGPAAGATEGEIAALTIQSTCKEARGNCAVCMDSLKKGEMLRTLPCMHRYHAACIDEWLKSSPTCPVCKTSILMGIYEGTMPSGSGDSDRPRHRRMRWSSRD